MPADDPFAFLAAEQPKPAPAKKPHWRDKLFSKDKNRSTPDRQIEDFLATSRPVPDGLAPKADIPKDYSSAPQAQVSLPIHHRDHAPPSIPSIPPISEENYAAFNFDQGSPPHLQDAPPQPRPLPAEPARKPTMRRRKNKGLRVGFSDRAPEIMGEGGDESEFPTIEISYNRKRALERQAANPPAPGPFTLPTPVTPSQHHAGRSPNSRPPPTQNVQEADLLNTLGISNKPGSRLSFRGSPDSHSFAERVRNQMQAEEGRALHNHYTDDVDVASPADDDQDDLPSPESPPEMPPSAFSPHDAPPPNYDTPPMSSSSTQAPSLKSVVQSIRYPSSPAVHRPPANLSPVDPRGPPPGLVPGSPSKPSSPPKPPAHEIPPANQLVSPQQGREPSRSPNPPKFSLRNVANQVGDTSFSDFKDYIARYDSILTMAAESVKPLMETSLMEWVRAAVWWFLRGKTRLESFARSRATAPPSYAKQAVIDLGKSLWINENIIPTHYELAQYGQMSVDALLAVANTTANKELVEALTLHQTTLNHLRSLSMSIKRNNILAVILGDEQSPSHLDTSIWLRYPFFAPDVSAVLSGNATRSMLADKPGKAPSLFHMMPLADTPRYFSYGSLFVQACVSSSEDDGEQYAMPCALTIIRERSDWYVFAAITSQSQLVNIMIQSDRKQGPTWDDVEWQVRTHSMRVKLPRGFELDVMFKEEDFKTLWNIVKYTRKSEGSLSPEAGETVVFENTLKVFQYMDPGAQKAFPPEPLERCRIRLFERHVKVTEGTGTRNAHRGFRLAVLTSPKVKTLSSIRHVLAQGAPVVFGLLRGEDGAAALLLKVTEDGRTRSMLMTFHESEERTRMHSVLLGMAPREGESKTPEYPLRAYSIEQPGEAGSGKEAINHLQFPAGNVLVIDQEDSYVEHGYGPTILSENLRAFIATEWGSVTDRFNMGPGELKLGLDVKNRTGMSLYRPAQQDLTVSLADNLVRPEMPDQVADFLQKMTAKPMVRRLDFANIQALHAFEQAVTGFSVIYDSIASSFTISRRRSMVPIYKKWEASLARVQIVKQEKVVQLLAFFQDFHHGSCMNFVLKGTDHIESFGRSGKFGIRIVDAKFALPKKDDDPGSAFVCLDMPEYPIEHDDIAITFDSEAERTNFKVALPGSVREPSRMGSLRR
ncbi:hypothetical protein N7481_008734 [Penicillium waksmanii]|uniref:uncharacterized protein n=1 Tax=Penicillium waksmanii TaxID=69791 RepID=UPI0025494557|nr:uncharacterized protein N7481_008734 [Penicillium waksmanii]KAJ5975027.1 hypothetical protein N7481_008734 [Penicillium waksmanii]